MVSLPGTVLVVDDDSAVAAVIGGLLAQEGLETEHASSGEAAMAVLAARPVDVVVSDVRMPGIDGMELLGRVRREWPDIPVVLVTAHGNVPLAVEAMKRGAADFVLKPFDREELIYIVKKALAVSRHDEATTRAPELSRDFIGSSPAMRECFRLIAKAAQASATVLLRGESGTGKEVAARAIHDQSARRSGPFVAVHCGALPEPLLESELFGYEKGAFTGATARKPGRVELAAGGTLFLDEIGDISAAVQVKLLRLVQERELQRLGATQAEKVDLRFIAATHRNLEEMVAAGQFREDLFFRLNVIPLWLPPLRDRPEDIEPLSRHFCGVLGPQNQRPDCRLEPTALALLRSQPWPGNVRQLENFIERLVVMSERPSIGATDVEQELARGPYSAMRDTPSLAEAHRQVDREAVLGALRRAGNNRTLAARLLGVSRRTLYNKLTEFQLQ